MERVMESQRTIRKPPVLEVSPNLRDYETERHNFSWDQIRAELSGLPHDGGLNIAYEAVDRHAHGERGDHLALRWISKDGQNHDYTYLDLMKASNRFANVLRSLGVGPGDRVFNLAGRMPETYITALGAFKNNSVFCPLFSAFGPEPILQRMQRGNARILVTTERLYSRKAASIHDQVEGLAYVLITDIDDHIDETTLAFHRLMEEASDLFDIPPTDPQSMAVLHLTSGTTGMPKGAVHVHRAVMHHYMSGQYALDLHPDDVFWCTADPGWVTGVSYGMIAPLTHGLTNIVDEAEFDAERWCQILQDNKITVWYTAPTAIRRLMRLGIEPRKAYDLSHLRLIHSVGEPLNPEAVLWGQQVLGLPIHDNWWQTETGGIMIANYAAMDIRPGSMGRPLPGIEAAIVQRQPDGSAVVVDDPRLEGDLALKPGWPSMFRTYLHDEERYRKAFVDGWYITGDLARRDADGYFWFVGRSDDIIKTSGHMVGPFEVESALIEHPDVAEVGVIGKPDPIAGQIVKAFVSLREGVEPSEALRMELLGFGRKKLGVAVAPKEIEFQQSLPRTRSGKIMRRLLKARELGLPEGDLSTLESD